MKKFIALALSLLLALTLLPVGAAAVPEDAIGIGRYVLESGYYITSLEDFDPTPTGGEMPGSYAMYEDGTLTLKNFTMTEYNASTRCGIYSESDLTVVLLDGNTIGGAENRPSKSAIRSRGTLTVLGSGSLTAYGGDEALSGYEGVNIEGGTLTLDANIIAVSAYDNGGTCQPLSISGGTVAVHGGHFGLYCGDLTVSGESTVVSITTDFMEGIYCGGDLTIGEGTISIESGDTGIECEGDLTVSGGTLSVEGDPDGIDCEGNLTVSGGTVTATGLGYGIYNSRDNDKQPAAALSVTGGAVTAEGGKAAIFAEEILLGSDVPVRAGGTVRIAQIYGALDSESPDDTAYFKIVTGSVTKYYKSTEDGYEEISKAALAVKEEDLEFVLQVSTFSSESKPYFALNEFAFVGASTEVVLGAGAPIPPKKIAKEKTKDDDEQTVTGKIVSYEKLSRLSGDYKAMKEYAAKLGLGDAIVVGAWDIETKGSGPWTIVFHLDAKYLGDTLTILHKKDDGTIETFTAVVGKNGEAAITVTSASPFLVLRGAAASGGSVAEENPNTGFDFHWWF